MYIFLLSSCKLMEAFIILPCLTSKKRFEIQQNPFAPVRLCCPYHLYSYGLIRHPLVCPRFIRLTLLLSFPSRARRASPVDSASFYPCRRRYPATVLFLFSQSKERIYVFAHHRKARPAEIDFYEATSPFTFVTTRIVARLPYCRLCRWASEGSISTSPCHPCYIALAFTMTGLPPARNATLRWARL